MLLSEIVATLGGVLQGSDCAIDQLAPLEEAQAGQLAFLANPKYRKQLQTTSASAVIVNADVAEGDYPFSLIVTQNPYLYFAKVLQLLHPKPSVAAGIHSTALVAESAQIDASAYIGPYAVIGENAIVGPRTQIHAHVHLAQHVKVGEDCILHASVSVYQGCTLRNRVILHSGVVIGADGFGLAWDADHWEKIPQVGAVLIDDDVEVGANTTIDRGALSDTWIAKGAKLDNQIQIGHNVHIGEHTAVAGCVGIAGSTKIGKNCTIGGAVMMAGHLNIADGVHIAGGTAVMKSIHKAGAYAGPFPFSESENWLKNAAHLRHLDKLANRVKMLEQQLQALQERI